MPGPAPRAVMHKACLQREILLFVSSRDLDAAISTIPDGSMPRRRRRGLDNTSQQASATCHPRLVDLALACYFLLISYCPVLLPFLVRDNGFHFDRPINQTSGTLCHHMGRRGGCG